MNTVLIVEDNPIIQNGLEKILLSLDPSLDVIKTGYAKEAFRIAGEIPIDMFLLDIQLYDYSGMELGEQIRSIKDYLLTPIIFITAIPSQEILAFKKIHCYDYIVKPFSDKKAIEVIAPIIHHSMPTEEPANEVLQMRHKGVTYNFRQDEIIFIEARNRQIEITTLHETAVFRNCTLSSIENDLKETFIRCHKGFIVNRDHVLKINHADRQIIVRSDHQPIPIGRKYALNVKEI